jgi:hypothetical protein
VALAGGFPSFFTDKGWGLFLADRIIDHTLACCPIVSREAYHGLLKRSRIIPIDFQHVEFAGSCPVR